MKLKLSLTIIAIALLLASCGNQLNLIPRADLSITLIDSTKSVPDFNHSQIVISPKIDEKTGSVSFFIHPVRFYAFTRPGSVAVNIESYTIDYFYGDGTQIETGTGASMRGNTAVHVPAGWKCPKPGEDDPEIIECTITSKGAVAVNGEAVVSNSFYAIDMDIILKLWNEADGIDRSGAYAMITAEGTDTNGNHYSKKMNPVNIIFVAE